MPSPTPLRDARHRAGLPTQRRAVGATNTSPCKQSSGTQQTAPSGKTAEYFGEGITASSFVFPAERTPRPYRACICEWDYGIALGSSAHLYVLLQKNNHKKKGFCRKGADYPAASRRHGTASCSPRPPFLLGCCVSPPFPPKPLQKVLRAPSRSQILGVQSLSRARGGPGVPPAPPPAPRGAGREHRSLSPRAGELLFSGGAAQGGGT